jgi:PadR family transcriptional regulator, regulatory protein PadR
MPPPDLPSLSKKEFIIMSMLVGAPRPLYGLQMVDQSQGELKRASIYVTLKRLQDKGYITSEREAQQPGIAQPRRLYKASGLGVKVFRALESVGGKAWLKEALAS